MSARAVIRQAFYDLRAKGYSPIPVHNDRNRIPCIKNWQIYCTRQALDVEINGWLRSFPNCNVAICGGYNGVVFIDVDDPFMLPILGQILTAETTGKVGSKGVTAFYRSTDTRSRAMGVDGRACIELLGAGRNTTVPPSIHYKTGQPYRWLTPLRPAWELPTLPEGTAQACYDALVRYYGHGCYGNPAPAAVIRADVRPGTADGRMRAWAVAALEGEAERVGETPEGGRANRLFASAAAVGKYVVHSVLDEAEVIESLMSGAEVCGLLAEEGAASVVAQIRSGISKAVNDVLPDIGQTLATDIFRPSPTVPPGGSMTPVAYAQPVAYAGPAFSQPAAAGQPVWSGPEFVWAAGADLPPEEPELIEGLLPESPGQVAAVVGASGQGKSFYAVMQAACLAAGKPFLGRAVKYPQGVGVIYAAAEGEGTILPRLHAARKQLGLDNRPIPFGLLTKFGNLLDPAARAAFVDRIKRASAELEAAGRGPARVVYIDTVSAAFSISDENNNSEVAELCKTLRTLGDELGALIVIIHHMGKNKDSGMRGASAWRDNINQGVSIIDGVIRILKDRNAAEGVVCDFKLTEVTLDGVMNQWGKPRTTAVIERTDATPSALNDDFDAIFDKVSDGGNDASVNDVKCGMSKPATAQQRGRLKRWLDGIKKGTNNHYFMGPNEMIVRKTPETMMNEYRNGGNGGNE